MVNAIHSHFSILIMIGHSITNTNRQLEIWYSKTVQVGDRFRKPWECMHSLKPWNEPTFKL